MSKLMDLCFNITDGEHGTVIDDPKGNFFLLSNKNIVNGKVNIDPKLDRRINESTFNKINKRTKIETNDVLISTVGTIGKTSIVEKSVNFAVQRSVGIIKTNHQKLNPYYLKYQLMTSEFQNRLKLLSKGAVQKCLFIEDLKNLEVLCPSIETQNKVAHTLKILEDKISNNNKINAELESLAKTIYDYWFLQFEFPNEEGKPYKSSGGKMVWNEELKREIPEGWRKGSLSDICSITMGASPNGESLNENQNGLIFYQGKADFSFRFPSIRMFTTSPIRYAKKNDVLISVRAPVGDLNIANNDCCIGRGLAALHSSYPSYLYYKMVSSKNLFSYYNQNGTTFGAVTKENLHNLEIVVPNEKTIMLFEKTISPLDKKISILSQENQELSSLRDFLLPMLMNGQISFSDDI